MDYVLIVIAVMIILALVAVIVETGLATLVLGNDNTLFEDDWDNPRYIVTCDEGGYYAWSLTTNWTGRPRYMMVKVCKTYSEADDACLAHHRVVDQEHMLLTFEDEKL